MKRVTDAVRTPMLAVVVFALATVSNAQTCTGAASLDRAPLQLGAGLAFSSSERVVNASFTGGHDAFFGFGHAGYDTDTALSLGAPLFSAGIGGSFPPAGRAHICSLVDVSYLNGPSLGAIDTHSLITTAGGQVGIVAYESGAFRLVPTVGAAFRATRTTATVANRAPVTLQDQYGLARFGVGLIANSQFAVTTLITVPFALIGGETSVGVSLTYNFK